MAPRSRLKAQPAPIQPAPIEEEFIGLDTVSDSSDEEDTLPAPAKGKTAAANTLDNKTTRVAPIVIKSAVKSNRAIDIDLLFDRGKGKQSVCKVCK